MDHPIVAIFTLLAAATGLARSEFLFSEEMKRAINEKLISFNENEQGFGKDKFKFLSKFFERQQREGNYNEPNKENTWPAEMVKIEFDLRELTPDAIAKLDNLYGNNARLAVYKTLQQINIGANFVIRRKDKNGQPGLYSTIAYRFGNQEHVAKLFRAIKAHVQKAYGISDNAIDLATMFSANVDPQEPKKAATKEEVKQEYNSWLGQLIMAFTTQ